MNQSKLLQVKTLVNGCEAVNTIEWVQLKAIQVGSGLTAVVARINFNDTHSKKLDDVWHDDHEPYMERSKTMGAFSKLHPVDRQFATYKATQKCQAPHIINTQSKPVRS